MREKEALVLIAKLVFVLGEIILNSRHILTTYQGADQEVADLLAEVAPRPQGRHVLRD